MSFLTLRALLFVGECLLASLLLPLLAFAVTRMVRRAALRHLLWLTMFGVLALLPFLALVLPARQIVLPAAAPAVVRAVETPPAPPLEMLVAAPTQMSAVPMPAPQVEMIAAPGLPPRPQSLLTRKSTLSLLVLLWVAGVFWHLGGMALGGIGLMRLRRQSIIVDPLRLSHAAAASGLRATATSPLGALRAQGGGRPLDVRLSSQGPATFGIFRPLVLLPETARAWSAARLAAVLAHEAAHVRRHDVASQSLAGLVCAFYWFNPLLWLAARALRREAEFAADDAVLAEGMTPSAYAAELVAMAYEIVAPPRALRALGAGMADSQLATRVESVLAANISRKGATAMDIARTLSLGLAAALLLSTARIDLALAQPAQPGPLAKPAPAAPPAPDAAPNINIEINRDIAPRVDAEVEAIKARADAAAAQARARAESEPDAAKRAQYREEAARVAAAAAEAKARADETRQRMTQVNQQMQEAQQRAREAEQRALESRMKADEARRRMALAEADRAHIRRISATISGVRLETQVVVPVEADLSKETQSRIDAAVSDAMGEARKKIEAAIADAKVAPPHP